MNKRIRNFAMMIVIIFTHAYGFLFIVQFGGLGDRGTEEITAAAASTDGNCGSSPSV